MSSRGHGPPSYGGRSNQAPGMMRHGSYPVGHGVEPQLLDNRLKAQLSEIERLASDNQRLAATHVALRQDLVATQQEEQRMRAHVGSLQMESDVQIRVLLDNISKMESQIRGGEHVKEDLQRAHAEARALVAARQDLIGQIDQMSQELENVRADVDKIPKMEAELDGLKQERHKLRSSFEFEKGRNVEKVAQLEILEKDLVGMAVELERLRAQVSNAEKRANAPNVYGEAYIPPPNVHISGGGYVDGYGNHHYHQAGYGGNPQPQWGGAPIIPYAGPPAPLPANPQ